MVTPWLKLLGKGAPDPPMLHISLKRTGSILKKAKAEVRCVMTRLLLALTMSMCTHSLHLGRRSQRLAASTEPTRLC